MRHKRPFACKGVTILFLLLLIGACASAPKKDLTEPPRSVAPVNQSDTALFQQSLALLGTPGKPADYDKARASFDNLIRLYPKSKWRPSAESYRQLLDELKASSDRAMAASLAAGKAKTETDDLKLALEQSRKSLRLLQEKLQAETARLQQENEQLKNDLQRLKQLEIDLQKRERTLR